MDHYQRTEDKEFKEEEYKAAAQLYRGSCCLNKGKTVNGNDGNHEESQYLNIVSCGRIQILNE